MVPRLFTDQALGEGVMVELENAQTHYLVNVLRRRSGSEVKLFNGRDGEWRASLDDLSRKRARLRVADQLRAQQSEPDVWLCFAPVKRARIDYLVEKASELGVARLQPVYTAHTIVERVNLPRLLANAIEAAEQSERLSVPSIGEPLELLQLLAGWPANRRLMLCDETGSGPPILDALATADADDGRESWAILIGPEGGFTRQELDRFAALPQVTRVGLGPRILRADTAALAALAVWQARLGDWRKPTPVRWPDYASAR